MEARLSYVSWAELHRDVVALMETVHKEGIVGIVGVPRSGMIPASQLAVMMGVPLTSVNEFVLTGEFHADGFSRINDRPVAEGPVLLLEDSVNTGRSLLHQVKKLGGTEIHSRFQYANFTIIPASLYTAQHRPPLYCVRQVPHPRIFAWNWLDSWITSRSMFDIDGVICADPRIFDDEPTAYIHEIKNLLPRYITKQPAVHTFCTNRLERFRDVTEEYLRKHGLFWNTLLMRPEKTAAERRAAGPYGRWKGERYAAATNLQLFVESDRVQAELIFRVSGKPVLCTDADKMFTR